MAISPILASGMIQRTEDVAVVKHQQDSKPMVEQQNLMAQITKKTEESRRQVIDPEDTNKTNTHADAREESKNKYFSRKKQEKKKIKQQVAEDCVVRKTNSSGFDIKV